MRTTELCCSRIAVVGSSGSGKTTTARRLSTLLDLKHIELDALYWQKGWVPADREVFHQKVAESLCGDRWVTDGNYRVVRDIVWGRAGTLVWLDYPLAVAIWSITRRTIKRIITREELWNGNRETWRGALFDKDSLFLYAIRSHQRHRREYPLAFHLPEYAHLTVVHLKSRKETEHWFQTLGG